MADFTILSQRAQGIVRCNIGVLPSATLQEFTPQGVQQVDLNDTELRAFLRALPPALLREVLGEVTHFRERTCPDCGLREREWDALPCNSLSEMHRSFAPCEDVPPAPVLDLRGQSLAKAILRLPEEGS